MDSNKEEASRCLNLVKEALASGDHLRALRFIRIAQRLNPGIDVSVFLRACDRLNSIRPESKDYRQVSSRPLEPANGDQCYTEENDRIVKEIRKHKDYYAILGLEKNCSVDEIRRAYKKLSLKVHPDKNKAPGAEEAFKKVGRAFKCLSDEVSRRQYDRIGSMEECDMNNWENQFRRRRRRTARDYYHYDDYFDPDDVFGSFFFGSNGEVFRRQRVYRDRTREPTRQQREQKVYTGFDFFVALQAIPFVIFLLLICLSFMGNHYSLQKTHSYSIPKVTEKHGVEYFVKSLDFDQRFPEGSHARVNIENNVLRDYKGILGQYCHMELHRRQWSKSYPTPHCNKLRSLGAA